MKTDKKLLENTSKYRKTKKGVITNMYNHQKQRRKVEYSLKELQELLLEDKKFDRLFKAWEKSGYKKELKPTIDRINCKLDYKLDNIHLLTWSENRYKQRMELKIIRAKKCYMHLNGKIVKIFNSQREALKTTGLSQGNLSMALNGKRQTCGGYNWSYENPELLTN